MTLILFVYLPNKPCVCANAATYILWLQGGDTPLYCVLLSSSTVEILTKKFYYSIMLLLRL